MESKLSGLDMKLTFLFSVYSRLFIHLFTLVFKYSSFMESYIHEVFVNVDSILGIDLDVGLER